MTAMAPFCIDIPFFQFPGGHRDGPDPQDFGSKELELEKSGRCSRYCPGDAVPQNGKIRYQKADLTPCSLDMSDFEQSLMDL